MVRNRYIAKSNDYRRFKTPPVFEPKQKKERNRINFRQVKNVLIFGIVLFLIYFLLYSPKFRISDIIVEGNSLLAQDEVINAVPKDNIFRLNTKNLKNKLRKDHPEIQSVEIYRGIPNALKIVIIEYDGKVVWQSNGNKYLISSQGEVVRLIKGSEGAGLPVIIDDKNLPVTPGELMVSPSFIAFITNVYGELFTTVNIHPDHFEINETTFDVNLYTDAGFYIKLDSLRSSKQQLDNLKMVLVSKRSDVHQYVDVRINGWAYYQ